MFVESLKLTAQGRDALLSAQGGGVVIRPVSCEFGDFKGTVDSVPESLQGNTVCTSSLMRYVEVLSASVARFCIEIPAQVPNKSEAKITECLLRFADGIPFAYVQLQYPIWKLYGNAHRVSFLLYVSDALDLRTVIDVQISEFATVPQVSSVNWLPNAATTSYGTVAVADVYATSDGSRVAGFAVRAGLGEQGWSFPTFDRVFADVAGSRFISPTQFKFDDIGLKNGQYVILTTISGVGSGYARAGKFDGTNIQLETDVGEIAGISPATVIGLWVQASSNSTSAGGSIPWPDNSEDVPDNWVLVYGANGPTWAPPSTGSATAQGVVLYQAPSQIGLRSLVTTATPDQTRYQLPVEAERETDVLITVGGAAQPTSAFSVRDDYLDLSEAVTENMDMNIRVFTREPSQGHALTVDVLELTGDGSIPEIDVGADITSVEQIIMFASTIMNGVSAYTVAEGKVRLTEALPSGMSLCLYVLRTVQSTGTSTQIYTSNYTLDIASNEFVLPVVPVSKNYVIMLNNGLGVPPSSFQIIDGVLYTNTALEGSVQIITFLNVNSGGRPDRSLDGVITDAFVTPTGVKLRRHNKPDLNVPMPRPVYRGDAGIVIDDSKYPQVVISYDKTQDPSAVKSASYETINHVVNDTEELSWRKKVSVPVDTSICVNAVFDAQLGPGFSSSDKREYIECLVSIVPSGTPAPDFSSGGKGMGVTGFSAYSESDSNAVVYASRSCSIASDIVAQNHPSKTVEIVVRMRVVNGTVSAYGARLSATMTIQLAR